MRPIYFPAVFLASVWTSSALPSPYEWVPASYSPPFCKGAQWTPCDIADSDCECVKLADDTFDYYCGYLNPTWASDPTPPATTPPQPPTPGPTVAPGGGAGRHDRRDPDVADGHALDARDLGDTETLLRREIFTTTPYPILQNRFPAASAGKWVTGIKGYLPAQQTIQGVSFLAGAYFEIRWDWAEVGSVSALQSGKTGAHVNVFISDKTNKYIAAFYDSTWTAEAGPSQGYNFYQQVISVLGSVAGYTYDPNRNVNTDPYFGGEGAAAARIAQKWVTTWLRGGADVTASHTLDHDKLAELASLILGVPEEEVEIVVDVDGVVLDEEVEAKVVVGADGVVEDEGADEPLLGEDGGAEAGDDGAEESLGCHPS
ncbi:MAG: hypothetical protein M1838_004767 [Thelocarpon superellum]|nr:MAG: hypothetical protein M1838_004767 [Thelocarpon superellum]